jgi:16S rRNA (cytidine1402-2'-O)-methyltransferase
MLYIIATPIGNLKDITQRALETLREVDLILAEDTRVTKKLLDHFEIKKELISYHQHSKNSKASKIIKLMKEGKDVALVSDSGTPGVSDPGNKLVQEAVKEGIKISPIPGPSAITALISVAGFATDRFLFLGFIPPKNKRNKFLEKIITSEYPVVFYESCHKILKTLEDLKNLSSDLELVVGREMTKKFETIYRGEIEEVIKEVKSLPIKGEFSIIVKKK